MHFTNLTTTSNRLPLQDMQTKQHHRITNLEEWSNGSSSTRPKKGAGGKWTRASCVPLRSFDVLTRDSSISMKHKKDELVALENNTS